MFNYKRIGSILVFLIIAYCILIAVRPAKIVRVDNNTVFVENLPMTNKGKLSWWLKNKELLQNKYHIINPPDNFTVIIMNFDGYEKLPKGVRDGSIDDYTCFDDNNGEQKKCVYNSIAIVVRGSLGSKIYINIDKNKYTLTPDGKVRIGYK
ncbi:DUF943 family protein [Tatumella sp. UCD-D_suzukii]|uniref:DUF943 family protein n=1 Tax=Tatumella sp. UCD-D_suzukii TaxID=1408192 RepID=UPI00046ECD4D|nr:DUF943 family protein [Tatumella sp. UCD-D_suzukii]